MEISACHIRAGNKTLAQKNLQSAINLFDKQITANPRDSKPWICKGYAYRELEAFEEADQCYRKAMEVAPDVGTVWSRFGAYLDCAVTHRCCIMLAVDFHRHQA